MAPINNLELLTNTIQEINRYFLNRIQKQVNVAMIFRNWLIVSHIVEYEQQGEDRSTYGKMVLGTLADRLKNKGLKAMGETNLKFLRHLYPAHPKIRQTLSDELKNMIAGKLTVLLALLPPKLYNSRTILYLI